MTLQAVAGFLGQSGIQHPANLYRNLVGALAGKRSGFLRYNDFAFTPSGSGMSLNIGPGDAVLMGTEAVTTQGGYYVWNNATETLAWPAATTLPRIDSLILRVIDTDYGADAAGSKATWEVVSGTPAASPVAVADSAFAPAGAYYHPGAWLRVANFQVGANATNLASATLTHMRRYARVGRHTLANSADFPTDAQIGDVTVILDTTRAGIPHVMDGSGNWHRQGVPYYQDYSPLYYTDVFNGTSGLSATTVVARYVQIGDLVHCYGSATLNAISSAGVGVGLPTTSARRHSATGSLYLSGAGTLPTDVFGNALMNATAPYNRVALSSSTNGYRGNGATGQTLQWNLTYES